jgi:hypothetical protein
MDGRRPEPRQRDEQSRHRTTEAGKQTDNGQGLTIFLPPSSLSASPIYRCTGCRPTFRIPLISGESRKASNKLKSKPSNLNNLLTKSILSC